MNKPDLKPISEMSNDEFNDFVMNSMMAGWIPLKMYLKIYPTETKLAIETRLNRKVWKHGVHYKVPSRGHPWVNLHAIRAWIEE